MQPWQTLLLLASTSSHARPPHMPEYAGPPPPSGTTQSMFCEGHLMSHVLQWMQFCALICSRRSPPSSRYSYTPAGQKRCSGPSKTARLRATGTESSLSVRWGGWLPSWLVPVSATDERRSKDTSPSGFGYSMGENSEAGLSLSWSAPPCERVNHSRPRVT